MKLDGFRAPYGCSWVTEAYFYRLPFALKELLGFDSLVVGHDPRPSSTSLYAALIQGAQSAGIKVVTLGVVPTPMIAKWVNDKRCYGLMVTASHNPVSDNGVKFIGFYINEQIRDQLIKALEKPVRSVVKDSSYSIIDQVKSYYIKELITQTKKKKHSICVDTAGGSWGYHIDVLTALGFSAQVFDRQPINTTGSVHIKDCISYYPDNVDYVVAFDGDGDRLQLLSSGVVLDGDDILAHLAQKEEGVVGTIMSNGCLKQYLEKKGIHFYQSDVGDCYVHKLLLEKGYRYGAEPCGHIIDKHWMALSDPVYILSQALSIGEIKPLQNKLYQKQLTFPDSDDIGVIKAKFQDERLRVVVRYSNTESVIRVMLEGEKAVVEHYVLNSSSMSA